MGDPAALEAHLFGTVDSSGAGPQASRPGLVDLADSGVLYVDEVTRLSTGAQSRLLRMIEHGEVLPVGGLVPHRIDVVVLAGATSDPRKQAQAGRFRHDLLYRLAVVEFRLPPLRERREDISYLVAVFVRDAAARLGKPLRGLAPEAEALLLSAPWHGNVRELQGAVERACLMSDGTVVSARDVASAVPAVASPEPGDQADVPDDGRPLSTVERDHIVRALQRAGGNKKAAARMLGVSRRALYRKLERLDLSTTISRRRRRGADGQQGAYAKDFDGVPSPARVASAAK
jgi:two-component system response regulator HydG